ncbi:TPR repeat-containing protein [Oscillochloris trichoides DG-6]|uniref:TPR repeat-containing protein n=1 Tax=Oscillochloris trichoides DG-6 TaxID=765420 RepID=E1IC56_9CHLR|nr:hypothetical protein [Oscillochloris trichoides]EFO81246.1 TPR repeat-containing protein [Oscillochloris trichoides DG-6]
MSEPLPLWKQLYARWWYVWGLSLCYTGNRTCERAFYQAGVVSFGRALRIWPTYAHAYYQRGIIRGRELREPEAAIEDLSQASLLDPTWPEPYLHRGLLQRYHGDPHAAMVDLAYYVTLAEPGYWRTEALQQIEQLRSNLL